MNQKDKIKAISAAKNDTDIESDELFLFTYTNRDNYIPPESTAPTTKWIKSPLVDKIENSRLPLAEIHPISSIDEKHIVDYRIHTMQPLLDDSFIEMNLMIYFPASTKSTKTAIKIGAPIELRLCRIRWYTSGLVEMSVCF